MSLTRQSEQIFPMVVESLKWPLPLGISLLFFFVFHFICPLLASVFYFFLHSHLTPTNNYNQLQNWQAVKPIIFFSGLSLYEPMEDLVLRWSEQIFPTLEESLKWPLPCDKCASVLGIPFIFFGFLFYLSLVSFCFQFFCPLSSNPDQQSQPALEMTS